MFYATNILLVLLGTVVCQHAEDNKTMECSDFKECYSCMNGHGKNADTCDWCSADNRCYGILNICALHMRAQHAFNCPQNDGPDYDETFAKSIALPLIAAAAAPNTVARQACLDNNLIGVKVIKNYTISCNFDRKLECLAYLAKVTSSNSVAVAFRGPLDDHLDPYGASLSFANKMSTVEKLGTLVDDHYRVAFAAFWQQMETDVFEAIESSSSPEIWIVGQSYGGGLASILASVVASSELGSSVSIKLVTFGQPRMSDITFAQQHDTLVPYSFRLVNKNDVIPTVLPRKDPLAKSGPFHHRYEVWYPEGMEAGAKYKIGKLAEDGTASNSVINLSPTDHLYMFGKEISTWWKTKCKE